MHSLVPSFLPSFLYLQLDVCSHKIWCTHHLQMSLELPGESISFTNISDRGREFQRSWQTRCSSSRYFQAAVKMVICSYKYVCRHYVIQWCCYKYWLCFGRNGKSTSIQTQDWVYPVLTSSKKNTMASHDFSRQERAGGGMKERKRLVLKLHQDGRDEKKMLEICRECHWCDLPVVNFPSQQTARVFFLLVQGLWWEVENNWSELRKIKQVDHTRY